MFNPVKCFCGRAPEVNTKINGEMKFSFACKCGGSSVAVFVRSYDQLQALDLWSKLVENRLGQMKTVGKPDNSTKPSVESTEQNTGIIGGGFVSIGTREDSNPFRRHMRQRFGATFFGD